MATLHEVLTLAVQQFQAGHLTESETLCRQILHGVPEHGDALHLLGLIARRRGEPGVAVELIQRALATGNPSAEMYVNLGNALADAGRLEEAAQAHGHALTLNSAQTAARDGLASALLRLGIEHHTAGRLEAAVETYRRAITVRPDKALTHSNLGVSLQALSRFGEAVTAFQHAIDLRPDYAEALSGLSLAYQGLGDLEAAVPGYRRFLELRPERTDVHSHLLVTMPFMPSVTSEEAFAEHLRFGERYEAPFCGNIPPHRNDPDPERRLRIGYLSPMFRAHILMQNLHPVFQNHRRDQVSVHVFAQEPHPDATTRRMQDLADTWTFIHEMSDDEAAEQVRAAGIDILVHPMGHWYDNRITVLARKPAPIQISYTCNSSTTGLRAVDYSFVDPWLDFDNSLQALCVENLVSLSSGFLVTQYSHKPTIGEPPCRRKGHVTFGSFNNPGKLADAAFSLWARVLAQVPNSRLLVKGGNLGIPEVVDFLLNRLERCGIPRDRVDCLGHLPSYEDHFAAHDEVDLFLDPIPFTGGRTTEDALWLGVPVVTILGSALHSRNSANRLWRMGHPELITHDPDTFVRVAVELAHDHDRLAWYRRTLHDALRASSVMDFAGHTRQLETAYRTMWRRWCAGLPPQPFSVTD